MTPNQFDRIEQGFMTMSEYDSRFHELSKHATMILPLEQEIVCFFVRGLKPQLRIETEPMISLGRAFLDVVDPSYTMEELH